MSLKANEQENALCLLAFAKPKRAVRVARCLKPRYFDNDVYRTIAERLLTYIDKHSQAPGTAHLMDLIQPELATKRRDLFLSVVDDLHKLKKEGVNFKYVESNLDEFKRQQRQKGAILKAAKLTQDGKHGEADSLLRKYLITTTRGKASTCAADIEPRNIKWLWPGRLARGALALLAGDPGLGKSTLTLDWATRVSAGRAWPDGSACKRGDVLILQEEDSWEFTIVPRLLAGGGDLTRIHRLDETEDGNPITLDDISAIEARLDGLERPLLLIIDPAAAFLGKVEENNNAEVRRVLRPLGELTERRNLVTVMVAHPRKSGGALMHAPLGSVAWVNKSRTPFFIVKHPDIPGHMVMGALGKFNLGPTPPNLGYRIVPATVEYKDRLLQTSKVKYDRAPCDDVNLNLAYAAQHTPPTRQKHNDAVAWLRELLKDGWVPVREVQEKAEQLGYSWETMRTSVKEDARVKAFQQGGRWKWKLQNGGR